MASYWLTNVVLLSTPYPPYSLFLIPYSLLLTLHFDKEHI